MQFFSGRPSYLWRNSEAVVVLFVLWFFSCLAGGCKKPATFKRAFYYWKSNEHTLTEKDLSYLKDLKIQKLYLKFFEVAPDSIFGNIPVAKTQIYISDALYKNDSLLARTINGMEIVPVVYIKNSVLKNITPIELDSLSANVRHLIDKYGREKIKSKSTWTNEIQIDCDWTASTKENYFYFLKSLKKSTGKIISCTLRLYPYRYPDKMGVPPADKATLMCYNLINPLTNENKNAILDNTELESYLKGPRKYPLHLDVVLPVYSSMYVYQRNQFTGAIYEQKEDVKKILVEANALWYEVTTDMVFGDLFLRVGDKIKFEECSAQSIRKCISLLKKYVTLDNEMTVALFYLDEENLNQYTREELDSFYSDFN